MLFKFDKQAEERRTNACWCWALVFYGLTKFVNPGNSISRLLPVSRVKGVQGSAGRISAVFAARPRLPEEGCVFLVEAMPCCKHQHCELIETFNAKGNKTAGFYKKHAKDGMGARRRCSAKNTRRRAWSTSSASAVRMEAARSIRFFISPAAKVRLCVKNMRRTAWSTSCTSVAHMTRARPPRPSISRASRPRCSARDMRRTAW